MSDSNGHGRFDALGATGAAVEVEEHVPDSGALALLGHRILGAVSVVEGACETLARNGARVSPADRLLLEGAIERKLLEIADGARSLVHGDVTLP